MKKTVIITAIAVMSALGTNAAQWKLAGDKIVTPWAENIDVAAPHPEYPRPQMRRANWQNLNGLWNYAIVPANAPRPAQWDGEILVPFCPESALSGVGRNVGRDNELWYERTFTVPASWKGSDVVLHLDAVDWKCDVWVNNTKVASHTGGYSPVSANITPALVRGNNEITVRVWDPTDSSYQPRGKQVQDPKGIWYTPVTGIWQTVWLEPVPKTHIRSLRITPDIDRATLCVGVTAMGANAAAMVAETVVTDASGNEVARGRSLANEQMEIAMPADFKLWNPDAPNLYGLQIRLYDADGKQKDAVESYAAMRKFSRIKDADGYWRLALNNEPIFQQGPLDQGWWPDGLYTAPSHEALVYDIDKTKDMGFNMIRKHVKVEPATWYAHCDSVGIIVWQDMPSGDIDTPEYWQRRPWVQDRFYPTDERTRTAESEACYRKEWKEIIDNLYNFPCIGVWVPFNEAWGQFKTQDVAEWTKNYDPSRMCNPASGGNHWPDAGDILDLHNYPAPAMYFSDPRRVNVLGEYGGTGLVMQGHLWFPDRNWGYIQLSTPEQVTEKYEEYARMLLPLIERGFSAAVYTQTTDVEGEINGLMTYDRRAMKVDPQRIKAANDALTSSLKKQ